MMPPMLAPWRARRSVSQLRTENSTATVCGDRPAFGPAPAHGRQDGAVVRVSLDAGLLRWPAPGVVGDGHFTGGRGRRAGRLGAPGPSRGTRAGPRRRRTQPV